MQTGEHAKRLVGRKQFGEDGLCGLKAPTHIVTTNAARREQVLQPEHIAGEERRIIERDGGCEMLEAIVRVLETLRAAALAESPHQRRVTCVQGVRDSARQPFLAIENKVRGSRRDCRDVQDAGPRESSNTS